MREAFVSFQRNNQIKLTNCDETKKISHSLLTEKAKENHWFNLL